MTSRVLQLLQELTTFFEHVAATEEEGVQGWEAANQLFDLAERFADDASDPRLRGQVVKALCFAFPRCLLWSWRGRLTGSLDDAGRC